VLHSIVIDSAIQEAIYMQLVVHNNFAPSGLCLCMLQVDICKHLGVCMWVL
jgi:hypothetical protein